MASVPVCELPLGPVIPVSDIDCSRRFYEKQLGFVGNYAPGGYALRGGDHNVLFLLTGTSYPGQAEWPLASFRTDDLAATVAELNARGVALEQIHDDFAQTDARGIAQMEGMLIAWVRDPDDQVLSFFQLT